MNKLLASYTREDLEKKLLHMVEFCSFQLATEFIQLTEPTAKVIRTGEAELENTKRVLEFIVCIWPAWDLVEKVNPSYDIMKEWVKKNHEQALEKACICLGCKTESDKIN